MRRVLAGVVVLMALLLGVAASGHATTNTVAGSLTAGGADCSVLGRCVTLTTLATGNGTLELRGTFALTALLECSVAGLTYTTIPLSPVAGGSAVTSVTAPGMWAFSGAYGVCRVRASAYTSGTGTVDLLATDAKVPTTVTGGGGGGVASVTGTANRIDLTGTLADPIINISTSYVGQTTITTLGTIATGSWNATAIPFGKGGTGLTAAADDTTLVSSGAAWVATALPNCPDSGGNHLNYLTASNAFSCGTSGGGAPAFSAITGATNTTAAMVVGTGASLGVSGSGTIAATTAVALATARAINGVNFDGTAPITVTAAAGTLTGTTLNSSVVTSSLTSVGTIGTGVWQGSSIAVGFTDAKVVSVSCTTITCSGTNPASFSIAAGALGLTQLATQTNNTIVSNVSGGTASPSANTLTAVLDSLGTTQGSIIYRNASTWVVLTPGTSGQVLSTGGAGANPSWIAAGGTGTVTSIATTSPITGGTITTTGTIACATCGVTGSPLSQFAATTSAQFFGVISDETGGTGVVVGSISPSLTTPTIAGGTHTGMTSFGLRDTSAAFDVTLAAVSGTTLTAGRTLTLDMGNAAHTLIFGAASTLTFPTGTKTIVDSTVATLASLASIGTITTGVWQGTAVAAGFGGTGQTTYTKGDLLVTPGSTTLNKLAVGTDGQVLTADAASTNGVKWSAVSGTGTVTSIATTSPITGGTITTTGTIACATCVTSAAALTSTALMTGSGSQASQTPSATSTLDASGNMALAGNLTVAGTITTTGTAGPMTMTAIAAPATPSAGLGSLYEDSTSKNIALKNDAGIVNHGIQTRTATANNWIRSIADDGSSTISQPAFTDISGTATAAQGGTGQTTYTKGDLLTAPGGATLNKLAVGTDGQVLTADAASTNGVKWAAGGSGGGAVNPVVKTTTYTAVCNDLVLADATSGAFTVTLPAANTSACVVHVTKTDSTASAITVSRAGSDTINGATTLSLPAQYNFVQLVSEGTTKWVRAVPVASANLSDATNLALLNAANVFSSATGQSMTKLLLPGSSSGTLTVLAAAAAGTSTLTLPGGTTDFSATGGASQVIKQTSAGAAFTVARLACADLSDSGGGCTGTTGTGGGIIGASSSAIAFSGTMYFPVVGGLGPSATETNVDIDAPTAATVTNMSIQLSAALGTGNSAVFTVRKNAADTAVTCTISGASATSCVDTSHSFAVAQGDLLSIKSVTSGTVVATPNIVTAMQFGTTGSSGTVNSGTAGQAAEYTSTGTAISGVNTTGTGNIVRATSPTFVTPVLGTPTSGTLTNATGLPISTGVSGLGTNVATWLATPSSANLAAALTDETGSGVAVFGTSPTVSNPTINGVLFALATKTTTYTVAAGDFTILCDATSGAFTVTLPAAASHTGRVVNVKKIDSSANACTVGRTGSDTIDGATTQVIPNQYMSGMFQSDGTNWYIL